MLFILQNGVNIPHVENVKPTKVVYDPRTNFYTVTSIFQFRGGNIFTNPMIVYCQVTLLYVFK